MIPVLISATVLFAASAQAAQPVAEVGEVHVDSRCRILSEPSSDATAYTNYPRRDKAVCHLESVFDTHHEEQKNEDNVPERSMVYIHEQEYLLQNTTDAQVNFVVEQRLPEGWTVDSDPQPVSEEDGKAIFRVSALPGQIVRLHVGIRRAVLISDSSSPVH